MGLATREIREVEVEWLPRLGDLATVRSHLLDNSPV